MHTEKRKKLYDLELNYTTALKAGFPTEDIISKIQSERNTLIDNLNNKLVSSANSLVKLVQPIYLTKEFLGFVHSVDSSLLHNAISEEQLTKSRLVVEKLLKVNLGQTQWVHLIKKSRENIEGFCVPNGETEHFIFTQDDENGVISTDLLIHEMGHAADYTISRSLDNNDLLVGHSSFSEAVAYYCQYKYLSEYGTEAQRRGSLGAFIFTYLCIVTLRYCLKHNISLKELNVDVAINDDEFKDIIESYYPRGIDGKEFISSTLIDKILPFQELISLVFYEIAPRFGIFLAINFLGRDSEYIKRFIYKNTINTDIDTIIDELIPDYHQNVIDFENNAKEYIKGIKFGI
ncbi:hypothetical protein [Pectobacterium carotovorum]|uniref:hypothetical protein n=1 Tax=Pectobacterium carotovorum TaxID=554 RepID=UPI0015DF3DCC|nr:hypothetical protein [Pectobacterium carotovorum]MBA0194590.1 hypothetical protein [Pectobacterium carotovorum]MBA0202654.1 hypothetical protein [Pectobacterium carotovorum]